MNLFVIHWPLPGRDLYVDTWRAFIELREQGLARSIGVSNFTPVHIERLFDETGVTPAVNQISRFRAAEAAAAPGRRPG